MNEIAGPPTMNEKLEVQGTARQIRSSIRCMQASRLFTALCFLTVAGLTIPGTGPLSNCLKASPQSESLEFEFRPVGTVPEWTTADPSTVSSSSRFVIASDYRHYEREANEELWQNAIAAVARKLDERIALGAGRLVPVDRELIKSKLLIPGRSHTHVYQTPLSISIEPASEEGDDKTKFLEWHRCFMELELNKDFYDWATVEYERRIVESRVWQTALVVLSGFSLLVVLFGFLKFNHRTQGVYTGRLQSIAIFAAIAVIILALALSNSIVWL